MQYVLIATDSETLAAEVTSVLSSTDVDFQVLGSGAEVLPAAKARPPDLAILDFQIGNMGGMATCLDLRLENSGGRIPHIPVLLLLDRRADVFLARRAGARGWVLKPIDPIRLCKAITAVLAGGTFEDESSAPTATVVPKSATA